MRLSINGNALHWFWFNQFDGLHNAMLLCPSSRPLTTEFLSFCFAWQAKHRLVSNERHYLDAPCVFAGNSGVILLEDTRLPAK